ncbi:hypothetical protein Cni_G24206 [Canna indica]|uniref:Sde2 N-terminal ubiquitin domain-containing protein n=1 Tax=Canna indica TaxID=4628 RepID=A0AAQ3KVR4_9LILI|nr:hypothetical protein Cni_G24206 [Canna indica]
MASYQIFVKFLDGQTRCLQITSPTLSGETLRHDLVTRTGIPIGLLRLVSGIREISDDSFISASRDGIFPSLSLLLRLRGGKGGFGSLLRGAATKAGQKKTNNFDACRDMSGRRLRHVNAEKKLEEWKAEEEERRLEKLAEDFLKKKAKEVKKNSTAAVEKYLEKYREDTEKCMEDVEESVRQSFALYKESKRKFLPLSEPSSKRLKKWLGKKKMEESDSESDDSEDDDDSDNGDKKSVVLDDRNNSNGNDGNEGCSASGSFSNANSDGESLGGGSAKSNIEDVNRDDVSSSPDMEHGFGIRDSNSESDEVIESKPGAHEETGDQNDAVSGLKNMLEESESKLEIEIQLELVEKEPEPFNMDKVIKSAIVSSMEEPFDFNKYNSAEELEALGMEVLKTMLQKHGLKCGGTLQQRASRLFLLKTTPLGKLPKKLLAKP